MQRAVGAGDFKLGRSDERLSVGDTRRHELVILARVGGRFAIRPCFINPRSTLADADSLVEEVLAAARLFGAEAGT